MPGGSRLIWPLYQNLQVIDTLVGYCVWADDRSTLKGVEKLNSVEAAQ
jgi:hypothetical protein